MGLGKEGEKPGKIQPASREDRPLDMPSSGPTPAQRAPGLLALPSPSGQRTLRQSKARGRRHGRQSFCRGLSGVKPLPLRAGKASRLLCVPCGGSPLLSASALGGRSLSTSSPRSHLPEHTQSHTCGLEHPELCILLFICNTSPHRFCHVSA